jgi:glycosyltransferase involved in cell wall biosynthesis
VHQSSTLRGEDPVISFVWSPGERLPAGTGGSENYTVGQVRELNRRGIAARVVTIGLGSADGRSEFVDIPFHSLAHLDDVGRLDDTIVFVTHAPHLATRRPAYQILHVPPPLRTHQRAAVVSATRDRILIATSTYAAALWARFLDVDVATVHVVHPFAEPAFGLEPRTARTAGRQRVLYAGRLSPEKGIYTLLSMLHNDLIEDDESLVFTVTTAGSDKRQGRIIERMLRTHPRVELVPARTTPDGMAALMAEHDVVVMPSNGQYWHETFGIVSIEAQHAGARVVASDDGGLPETQCGALHLVEPDNSEALALGIIDALSRGPVSPAARGSAARCFTVGQSVDSLLEVVRSPQPVTPFRLVHELEELLTFAPNPPDPRLTTPGAVSVASGTSGWTGAAT